MPQADEADVSQHIEDEPEDQAKPAEGEQPDAPEGEAKPEGEAEEVVVSIGEEAPTPPEDSEPEFLHDLRKRYREEKRRARELESELQALKKPATAQDDAGPEPTLEGCDYDEAAFKREWRAWNQKDLDRQAAQRKKADEEETQKREWQAKLDDFGKAKAALKVKDYEEAEEAAAEILSVTQQGVILEGSKDPAVLIYALGKNPKKARELASITSPVKFAFAVAELERNLKVTPRTQVAPPERVLRPSAPASGAVNSELDRLRAEAAKTGDFSKVLAYKRQIEQKAKK